MKFTNFGKMLAIGASAGMLMLSPTLASAKQFKIASGDSQGGPQWIMGTKFIEELEARTDGKHTGALFLNGQLGSEQDTVNDAAIGTLDMSILAINNLTPFSPRVGIYTMPYVILSLDDAKTLTDGKIADELVEAAIEDAGVRIIAWTYGGFRRLTNSKKPVTTLEDISDVIIRVPKNEIMIASYKSWGTSPTPMAWSETFAALQTKVVDGQDNPYLTIHAMKFYEVQKYVTNIRYVFALEPLIISESVFQDQSPEDQQAILDAGKAASAASIEHLMTSEASIMEDLVAKGMQIDDPANDEKEWIEAATTAVWPDFYDSIGGIDRMNEILGTLGRDPVAE